MAYTTYLSQRISHKSIGIYLAGIQFRANFIGQPICIASMRRLYYLIRGIKRSQGSLFTRPQRLPITVAHLNIMLNYLRHSSFCSQDRRLFRSAVTLAYFGLLRCSEFVSPTISSYGINTLLVSDVIISSDCSYISLHIRVSKTDPFRAGCRIHIGSTSDHLCPVNAIRSYLLCRSHHSGPLYVFRDGSFLSRSRLHSFLVRCFGHSSLINTHSFRIGGALALAAAGIQNATIQVLGRWSSNCFTRYLHLPPGFTRSLAARMAATSVPQCVWDPNSMSTHFN